MNGDGIDPDFEARFLSQRLADMHRNHPAEAAITQGIMGAIDYRKACIRNELQLRGMVLALGSQLAKRSENSLPKLQEWLAQFVKDGALAADQAQHFMAQARALQP
ncbi:hypothetical protein EDF83_0624 [Pseudomonas protegens]|uniref:hypothetical protein n=1 Tax=Pseudomonas TaxID=286 RepID=UPI000F49D735|nr:MULTISPECIES: hypothetical protein [Pseudomonas]MCS4261070.1 hypothetical protein [Pseudomonas sp. BIGb0176]ROQ61367.1 hypothetical protein EDF83_0624 [Pseudomonas protegens]ROQ83686.1 hypothetical protein EC837_0541 [Pseudomonas protegens]